MRLEVFRIERRGAFERGNGFFSLALLDQEGAKSDLADGRLWLGANQFLIRRHGGGGFTRSFQRRAEKETGFRVARVQSDRRAQGFDRARIVFDRVEHATEIEVRIETGRVERQRL